MKCEITSLTECQTLNLLIIENTPHLSLLYDTLLQKCFQNIFYANSTQEGIELFQKHPIDLIICEQMMPSISGLEMIKQLQTQHQELLVILVTENDDSETLLEAVNYHISHFLLKPFSKEKLLEVIKDLIEPSIVHILFEKHTQEYMKSLKKYETSNKLEQEKAFTKQSSAIQNDFYYQYIQYQQESDIWYLNGFYKPYEILHGDTYSIRKIDDTKVIFFIIDAMGKGISASITSIIALTMINNYIDLLSIEQGADFQTLLSRFINKITSIFHEDEVLSILFAEIDIASENMNIASYAMPPILLVDKEDNIIKIRSNNIPISTSRNTINIVSQDITNIDKMLFCSDGIFEAGVPDGSLYFQHIEKDFLRFHNRFSFIENFLNTISKTEDDITLLWMNRLHEHTKLRHKKVLQTTKIALDEAVKEFDNYLLSEGVSLIERSKLSLMALELLTNAYEHGNLAISQEDKKLFVSSNQMQSQCQLLEKIHKHKKIYFHYDIKHKSGLDFLFMKIEDEGEGFDSSLLKQQIFNKKSSVSGRGFSMAKKISDALYYSPKGNTVIANKSIHKEAT